jgi:hypothetical protein
MESHVAYLSNSLLDGVTADRPETGPALILLCFRCLT